eukprot:8520821-Alexandrium_andersonii.AAC.1
MCIRDRTSCWWPSGRQRAAQGRARGSRPEAAWRARLGRPACWREAFEHLGHCRKPLMLAVFSQSLLR